MELTKEFRGVLNGYSLQKIDQNLIDLMVEKGVLTLNLDLSDKTHEWFDVLEEELSENTQQLSETMI